MKGRNLPTSNVRTTSNVYTLLQVLLLFNDRKISTLTRDVLSESVVLWHLQIRIF